MDANQIIGLVVAIALFVGVVTVALTLIQRRGRTNERAQRALAQSMRADAVQDHVDALEREAKGLETRAKAERAAAEAERLKRQAEHDLEVAKKRRRRVGERLRKAHDIDPSQSSSVPPIGADPVASEIEGTDPDSPVTSADVSPEDRSPKEDGDHGGIWRRPWVRSLSARRRRTDHGPQGSPGR